MTSQLKPQNYRLKNDFKKVHRFLDNLTLDRFQTFQNCLS